MVYETKVRDVEDLCKRIMQQAIAIGTILTNELLTAVREWRKRLRACVEAKGAWAET